MQPEAFLAKIRSDARMALDPDQSSVADELKALDWQLSEIARLLGDYDRFNESGQAHVIAQAKRCLETAVQRSYRARKIAEGCRVTKPR